MWKKLASKVLLDHPRARIVEDEIELHNGSYSSYLRFETRVDAAEVILVNDEGKIFVAREYSYVLGYPVYQFPGGALLAGEDPLEGAQRELREEAGFEAKELILLGSYFPFHRRMEMKHFVFVGRGLIENPLPADQEELFENFWFSEDEIDLMIKKGEMVNASLLSAWAIFKASKVSQNIM